MMSNTRTSTLIIKTALLFLALLGSSVARKQKLEQTNAMFDITDVLPEDANFWGRDLQMSIPPPEDVCIDFQLSFEFFPAFENGLIVPGRRVIPGEYVFREYFDAFGIIMTSEGGAEAFPRVFDSSDPCERDLDLGTPHRDFGGPGRGSGGRAGAEGENDVDLGNILIIQETNPDQLCEDEDAPNDKQGGGTITFDFTDPVRFVEEIGLIDVEQEDGQTFIDVTYFSEIGGVERFRRIDVDGHGNNGVQAVDIGLPNVRRLTVDFKTSGGITFINFCADVLRVGFSLPGPGANLQNSEGYEVTLEDTKHTKTPKNRKLVDSQKNVDSTKTAKGRKLTSTTIKDKDRRYTRGGHNKKKKEST